MRGKRAWLVRSASRFIRTNPSGTQFEEAMEWIGQLGANVQEFSDRDLSAALDEFGLSESEKEMLQETAVEYI